jgi:hypothetical protein
VVAVDPRRFNNAFRFDRGQAQPAAVTALGKALDADGAELDCVCRELEFHQPVPAGLMARVISRCAQQCGGNPTAIWRRDLVTVVSVERTEPQVSRAQRCIGYRHSM